MVDDTRPKPASFGFDMNFDDLSTVQPSKPELPAKTAKPKTVKVATPAKSAVPKPAVLKAREEASDKLAKSMGFASREAVQPLTLKKRRRTHHDEPVDQLSIRGPVRVLNDFITHCEDKGLSYWEGLEILLETANLPSKTRK
jgi:hypothetical protein